MTTVTARHPWLEALLAGHEASRDGASWLQARRAEGLERANALAVPTPRDEEWRFTDLAPLTRVPFRPAGAPRPLAAAAISPWKCPEAATQLVFVDGVFVPELSLCAGLPDGIVASPLCAALATHGAVIEAHLARRARMDADLFTALNTSSLRDGAFVWIAKGRKCPAPVGILFLSTQEAVTHPRCLVVAEDGAECVVIEQYAGLAPEAVYFTNATTEIVLGREARLRHVRLQQEARGAFHIATCAAAVGRDALYASHAVNLGARISRNNLHVLQQDEGVDVTIDGFTLIDGRQLADTHTIMDHARPNGKCRQVNKCIVAGAAHAVFNGKVMVRPGAQLTDSAQESRNLLLSDKARVDTKPQLEIFADDVRCTHGATVGQLDPEQLFYLRSRGLADVQAKSLLTYAFGAELIDRIPVPALVERLESIVMRHTRVGPSP